MAWQAFIDFWKKYYDNAGKTDQDYYNPYINQELTKTSLDKLWQWKMQDQYNRFPSKREQVRKMKNDVEMLRGFQKQSLNEDAFNQLLKYSYSIFRSGNVYRIFLFHIIWPNEFTILDQHVIRSFLFLQKGRLEKNTGYLIGKDNIKLHNDCLYNKYNDFVHAINKEYGISIRDIDKALMAFGQFLNNPQKFLKLNYCGRADCRIMKNSDKK